MSNHPLARANAPPCARCSGMRGKSPYVTTFPDCIKDTAAKADVCTLVGWLGNLRESANKDLFESLSLHFFWTKTKQFYSWRHRCSPSSIGNSTTPWCHLVHSSNGDNFWSEIYLKLIWRSLKELLVTCPGKNNNKNLFESWHICQVDDTKLADILVDRTWPPTCCRQGSNPPSLGSRRESSLWTQSHSCHHLIKILDCLSKFCQQSPVRCKTPARSAGLRPPSGIGRGLALTHWVPPT